VTYTFSNSTTADATQVNQNFTDIINGLSDTTKNISVSAGTFAGTVNAQGNMTIGASSSNTLTLNSKVTGSIVFTSAATYGITGTTTNDNAASGNVGEYVSSIIGSGSSVTMSGSGQWGDITNISLTAGDWDVAGLIEYTYGSSSGVSVINVGISSTSGNSSSGLTSGSTYRASTAGPTSAADSSIDISAVRISVASTTTYYLKYNATYTGGNPAAWGRLTARRVR